MYVSAEDARSDLFLSGAVYLFGPLILGIVLQIIPLGSVPMIGEVLDLLVPFATTALVPLLLIRYRKEPWSTFGIGSGRSSIALGALLALPIVAAAVLSLVPFQGLGAFIPGPFGLLVRSLRWLSLAFLAVYVTVKARDAFRSDPRYLRSAITEIGRILAIVAAAAVGLLALSALFTAGSPVETLRLAVVPAGVAVAVLIAYRSLGGPALTSRPTLLAPVVILALAPFRLTFDAVGLLSGIRMAAVVGGIGLVIGAVIESRRSALGVGLMALLLGVFTQL